ncbi:alpha/beta hydrolase [Actinomadura sp. 6N118]|uniref:alpha/beta hydrolase n=1 Tax=Actinomadura sp. 6N118 TaxID=3375151 RepID=UPI0037956AC7
MGPHRSDTPRQRIMNPDNRRPQGSPGRRGSSSRSYRCIDDHVDRYLIDARLPKAGTRCPAT